MGCGQSAAGNANEHACCPPGSWPALKTDYVAKGKIQDASGVKVYHIGEGKKVLFMFEDIFGIESGRHKALADNYALEGYNVYLPQFLDNPYAGEVDVPKILAVVQQQKLQDLKKKYEKVVNYLKSQGHTKFYAVGYCWGNWLSFKMSSEYDHFICLAGMHPSLQVEGFYGSNQVALTEKIRAPAFLYSGSNDLPNVKKGGQVVKILEKRFGNKSGVEEFPDMVHGWMVRAQLSDPNAKRDIEKGLKMTIEYFKKFE